MPSASFVVRLSDTAACDDEREVGEGIRRLASTARELITTTLWISG